MAKTVAHLPITRLISTQHRSVKWDWVSALYIGAIPVTQFPEKFI